MITQSLPDNVHQLKLIFNVAFELRCYSLDRFTQIWTGFGNSDQISDKS